MTVARWDTSRWDIGVWPDEGTVENVDWWSTSFLFRRDLIITNNNIYPIEAGYPITIEFPYDEFLTAGKIRDLATDIQIIYTDSENVSIRVAHKTVLDAEGITARIVFNAVEPIFLISSSYQMYYYSNLTDGLALAPLSYVESDYALVDTADEYTSNLSFSRPTEDWRFGFSDVINAKIVFSFTGVYARVKFNKGPDRGIVKLQLDNEPAILIDTFNPTDIEEIVYELPSDIDIGTHDIRLRVTGDKVASAGGIGIQFVSVEYSLYFQAVMGLEEVKTGNIVISSLVGV